METTKTTRPEPTVGHMLSLWLPLAASVVMMVLESSIINMGLGRTKNAEVALAAYGVALGLALLIEAPIMMLIDASVARAIDRASFSLLRRFTLGLSILVVATGLLVSLTPAYDLIVVDLMNIPLDVAARARPTLQLLAFWPLPIAWRRTHQGVLIRMGRTSTITLATGLRLVTLAGSLYIGMQLLPEGGAVVAGLAMDISVVAESALITWATMRVVRLDSFPDQVPAEEAPPLTPRDLWRFYRPLAATTILRQSMRPLLNAGIAAAVLPTASLAAWPVAWGFVMLITGPAWSLQQLTTAMTSNEQTYKRVRNFAVALSVFFSLVLAVIAFTPLYNLVMGGVYNLSPELQQLALPATQMLVVLPLVMGLQSVLRGLLIRAGYTVEVRTAMVVNVAGLVVTLAIGLALLSPTGTVLAAVASLAGGTGELAWLRWKTKTQA